MWKSRACFSTLHAMIYLKNGITETAIFHIKFGEVDKMLYLCSKMMYNINKVSKKEINLKR